MPDSENMELLEKAEAWGQTPGEHLDSILKALHNVCERLGRLEERVGKLESQSKQIPWLQR